MNNTSRLQRKYSRYIKPLSFLFLSGTQGVPAIPESIPYQVRDRVQDRLYSLPGA